MPMERPAWIKSKKIADDFEVIQAKKWDDYRDFKTDDGCYVLIRIYWDTHEIGVGICSYKHVILKEFRGTRAQDLYTSIFEYDKKHSKRWFNKLKHAAYLGKELKKAEIALAMGFEYVQE